jgi:hypothetical protein
VCTSKAPFSNLKASANVPKNQCKWCQDRHNQESEQHQRFRTCELLTVKAEIPIAFVQWLVILTEWRVDIQSETVLDLSSGTITLDSLLRRKFSIATTAHIF